MTAAVIEAPPDVGAAWRRLRLPILVGGILLLSALVLAVFAGSTPRQPLDPRDASKDGGRALAQLVRDRGVVLDAVTAAAGVTLDSRTTVFLPDPGSMLRADLSVLAASPVDVVVVAPTDRELRALRLAGVTVSGGDGFGSTPSPQCAVEDAMVAGDVAFAGTTYLASPPAASCYPVGGAAGLVVTDRGGGRTVVFGSAETFTNDRLDDEGDAALALSLLTTRPHLVWVLPQPPTHAPADTRRPGLWHVLPARVRWTTLQLLLAVSLVALWRARRLGPVVAEPLPVVVRATETVEGRARLLHAARARDTAAAALRSATVARLRELVGSGPDAPPGAVVDAVARATGRTGAAVEHLLYGAVPLDDPALVELATALEALERAVRQP